MGGFGGNGQNWSKFDRGQGGDGRDRWDEKVGSYVLEFWFRVIYDTILFACLSGKAFFIRPCGP